MGRRHDEHEVIRVIGIHMQIQRGRRLCDDSEIGRAFGNGANNGRSAVLLEIDLDFRMHRGECVQLVGQELGDRPSIRMDSHAPLRSVRVLAKLGAHAL